MLNVVIARLAVAFCLNIAGYTFNCSINIISFWWIWTMFAEGTLVIAIADLNFKHYVQVLYCACIIWMDIKPIVIVFCESEIINVK